MSKLPGECVLEPVPGVSQNKPVRFAFHGQELRSNIRELGFRKIPLQDIDSQGGSCRPYAVTNWVGETLPAIQVGPIRFWPEAQSIRTSLLESRCSRRYLAGSSAAGTLCARRHSAAASASISTLPRTFMRRGAWPSRTRL
jgi:hypothetical protein